MKKIGLFFLFALVVVVAFGPVGSALAITNGQPDKDNHPYVGLVTDFQFVCSGAMLSPDVFVTAAHCFDKVGKQVFITFDSEGLMAEKPLFYSGVWIPDPEFCAGCGAGLPGFDTHDVAVVIMDEPVELHRYASLPTLGMVDALPMGTQVDVVGYGVQHFATGGGQPQPDAYFTRYYAPTSLIASEHRISDEFMKLSANPAKGKGGICFGDSGGPDLLGGTDIVLGVNSFGTNGLCRGLSYSYRIDTPEALSFLHEALEDPAGLKARH